MFILKTSYYGITKYLMEYESGFMKTSDECTISLLNYPIESNKIGFVRKYQKYIDYYTEKYGHITIDFGVINYVR